jgi:cobalt/nickel transport system permease protein
MLNGTICPVTATLSAAGISAATGYAIKSPNKPKASWFAATSSLIFAMQMLNFPISGGTSGHLLGGVLAAALLGTPFGVLAMALVIATQTLLFSDGGLAVLGANIFNMAVIGAGVGGMLRTQLIERGKANQHLATAMAAWVSVILASCAVSAELAFSGKIAFSQVLPAMLGTHALIGIGESAITLAFCMLLSRQDITLQVRAKASIALPASILVAMMAAPFASSLPDGLEALATRFNLIHNTAPAFTALMPDYIFPFVNNTMLATLLAAGIGAATVFGGAWILARMLYGCKHYNKI